MITRSLLPEYINRLEREREKRREKRLKDKEVEEKGEGGEDHLCGLDDFLRDLVPAFRGEGIKEVVLCKSFKHFSTIAHF